MAEPFFEHCKYERHGPVLTITINRPQVLNALNPAAHFEMAQAFDLYAADPDLHVAIVTGSGDRAFCVGTDLKELSRTGEHRKPASGFGGITTRFDLFKPVIAAVNGLCLGGGAEMVAACDLAVASDSASFAMTRVVSAQWGHFIKLLLYFIQLISRCCRRSRTGSAGW